MIAPVLLALAFSPSARAQTPAFDALQAAGEGTARTAQALDGERSAPALCAADVPEPHPLVAAAVLAPMPVRGQIAVAGPGQHPPTAPGVTVPSKIIDAILFAVVGGVVGALIGSGFGMPALLFGATLGAGALGYLGFELGKSEDKATRKG